jgi:hypothetical protein
MADGDDDNDGVTAGEARMDETLGIDRSEQSGLGGDSSVLEEYGKDTVPDDEPEKPMVADAEREPVLPGTDPDVPADLAREKGAPDPTLPAPGHELREGPSKAVAGIRGNPLAEHHEHPVQAKAGASGNVE